MRHELLKKIWTHEGPEKKKETERRGPMKVLKKKEREEEIAMLSKEFIEREGPHKRSFHLIHHNPYTCTS